ncbi:hypothetical protein Airi02_029340 [Actinoallomurus iriomotensis]|uniref:Uncharacterized protein n=1 Tax=Actinoallomurus iriomotensis TaxID=478107 RepID=A0A9W6RZD8_9ACTN|nr:hypothetical protein Airi02_029340 [Actinoallomurus iriomotensis]
MLFGNPDGGKEGTVSQHIDGAPDTPGDAPITPQWRSRLLTSRPGRAGEPGEGGPERLTRHERIPEEGRRRGR